MMGISEHKENNEEEKAVIHTNDAQGMVEYMEALGGKLQDIGEALDNVRYQLETAEGRLETIADELWEDISTQEDKETKRRRLQDELQDHRTKINTIERELKTI